MIEDMTMIATMTGAGFDPHFWWWIAIWVGAMGMFFGSFMNVVVYRLPTGKALAYPGSACPTCGHAVRWYDNVPVLSWLLLRARCRDCRTPISARYPLVEAVVGAMFLWLVMAEVYPGGVTLPAAREIIGLPLHVVDGARRTAAFDNMLWLSFVFRLLLMCTLFCAALIEYDRRCPPLKLYWPAMLVGLLLPLWQPLVRPIPAWSLDVVASRLWIFVPYPESPAWVDGFRGLVVGLLAGALLAIGARNLNGALAAILNLAIVGVYLGWQAAMFLAAATAIAGLVVDRFTRRIPDAMLLFALTFIFMLNWGRLAEQLPDILGPHANWHITAIAGVGVLTIGCGMVRILLRRGN
jgi:leader peptidase (prepilin peptidase)/N-methyltransferase